MLTPDAIAFALQALGELLNGGQLVVRGPGGESASAPIDRAVVEGGTLTATATFGEDAANFEWAEREVVTGAGTVLDKTPEDLGRKAQGAVWTLDAAIELAPAEA